MMSPSALWIDTPGLWPSVQMAPGYLSAFFLASVQGYLVSLGLTHQTAQCCVSKGHDCERGEMPNVKRPHNTHHSKKWNHRNLSQKQAGSCECKALYITMLLRL